MQLDKRIKSATTKVIVSTLIASASIAAIPQSAQAEPAGKYDYECVSSSGLTYFLKSGEKTTNCKGSYLKQYIRGGFIKSFALTGAGKRALPPNPECELAVTATAVGVLTAADGISWVLAGASGAGALLACRSK